MNDFGKAITYLLTYLCGAVLGAVSVFGAFHYDTLTLLEGTLMVILFGLLFTLLGMWIVWPYETETKETEE